MNVDVLSQIRGPQRAGGGRSFFFFFGAPKITNTNETGRDTLPHRSHALPDEAVLLGRPHDGEDGGKNDDGCATVSNNPGDGGGGNGGATTLPVAFREEGDGVPRHLRGGNVDERRGGRGCRVIRGRRPAV